VRESSDKGNILKSKRVINWYRNVLKRHETICHVGAFGKVKQWKTGHPFLKIIAK